MGLRCLLGHDFGEAEVEREREENGDEMVVTIREVKTCQRCGTERVISENKEVTSIRTAEEVGLDSGGDAGAGDATDRDATGTGPAGGDEQTDQPTAATADEQAADDDASGGPAPGDASGGPPSGGVTDAAASAGDVGQADPESDDGVILPDEDEQRDRGEWPDSEVPHEGGEPTGATTDEEADAESTVQTDAESTAQTDAESTAGTTGDASEAPDSASDEGVEVADGERDEVEILDEDGEGAADGSDDTAGTAHATDAAESGDAGDELDGDAAAWPDHDDEDVGFDAEVGGGDDVSFSGNGLTPDVDAEDPGVDAEYVETDTERVEANAADRSGGRTDAGTGIAREGAASVDLSDVDSDAKFYCPNCGLTRGADESSMRAGDICPECRKGYIAEREE